jgi:hypothetical protein
VYDVSLFIPEGICFAASGIKSETSYTPEDGHVLFLKESASLLQE